MLKKIVHITIFIQSVAVIGALLMAVGALFGTLAGYLAVTWTQTFAASLIRLETGAVMRVVLSVLSGLLAALLIEVIIVVLLVLWHDIVWYVLSESAESVRDFSVLMFNAELGGPRVLYLRRGGLRSGTISDLAWMWKGDPGLLRILRLDSVAGPLLVGIVTGILIPFVPDTTLAGMSTSTMRLAGAVTLGLIMALSRLATALAGRRLARIAGEPWTAILVVIAWGFVIVRMIGSTDPCAFIPITFVMIASLTWLYSWSRPERSSHRARSEQQEGRATRLPARARPTSLSKPPDPGAER